VSGIAGIIRFDGASADPALLQQMTSALGHRGPDGISHWTQRMAALGHCMLRTTPESLDEAQPLASDDGGLVLVMDGRVDNREELRAELAGRGVVPRGRSDAALILCAYDTWERRCPEHIEGDFAFVIWDARRRQAFCARDRSGNKPFIYHWDGRTFAFASEAHAILALPWVRREFNEGMLAEYLGNEWYSKDETFWKGVMRLPGAHRMDVQAAGVRVERYWEPDLFAERPYTREEDHIEHYRALFSSIVGRLSRSHLPAAFEVSGGLDSSAILAMATSLRRAGNLAAPGIEGYTLDFTGDPDADEMAYARSVGEHLGIRIHEVPPSHRPLEWYRDLARHDGEFPGYPNGTMALELRERAREAGCRVLLAGEGGDEWLGLGRPGYYYAEELAASNWRAALACARADAGTLGAAAAGRWFLRSGVVPLLPEAVKEVGRRARTIMSTSNAVTMSPRQDWLAPALRKVLDERREQCQPRRNPHVHHRTQRLQLLAFHDAYGAIAREAEERSAARQGLELRLPFSDSRIIQFAFSSPERLRSLGRTTKRFHRLAMQDLLPATVLTRTTKADFMGTFRRQIDECEPELAAITGAGRRGWVDPGVANSYLQGRRQPGLAGWVEWRIWSLVGCDALV
jgi:asparagine synthase (glutamine-hydrolysing)